MNVFGSNLKKLMRERSLTAKVVSRDTGIPQSTLSEWLNGREPKLDGVVKLARFFGVSIEFLVTGEEFEANLISALVTNGSDLFATIHNGIYRLRVEKFVGPRNKKRGDDDGP